MRFKVFFISRMVDCCGKDQYPLRRGSSFTFLTPGPQWDFTLKRKRREKDDDVVSLCSLDFKVMDTSVFQETFKPNMIKCHRFFL
ncbi:rho GTPase-activating protein 30 [Platysternon megacephalum]|uniref:Rho GTPase-activating protein 30 n=1 Tax=Platysternon megacephalum TaxID=55544 RepID=A0A4D9EFT3_9SAUR|nr:rho GTPase-activating protein 30 [Platysternon megacephalum]